MQMPVFWDMALLHWGPRVLREYCAISHLQGSEFFLAFDLWRSGHHVTSKHWYLIIQGHNIISQKNGVCRI